MMMQWIQPLVMILMGGVITFIVSRSLKRSEINNEEKQKHLEEENKSHKKRQDLIVKAIFILLDANETQLKSMKRLKDEKGKPIVNGELDAYKAKLEVFHREFEDFIIEN